MRTIAAREAKNNFGVLIEEARREPVTIEKHGRPAVVVLSVEAYEQLSRAEDSLWATRAVEVVGKGEFVGTEESMRLLREFIARP